MSKYYNLTNAKRHYCKVNMEQIEADKRRAQNTVSADTLERKEIHDTIKSMINRGYNQLEILTFLSNKYSESKNAIYFKKWYDYHKEKATQKEQEDYER